MGSQLLSVYIAQTQFICISKIELLTDNSFSSGRYIGSILYIRGMGGGSWAEWGGQTCVAPANE